MRYHNRELVRVTILFPKVSVLVAACVAPKEPELKRLKLIFFELLDSLKTLFFVSGALQH